MISGAMLKDLAKKSNSIRISPATCSIPGPKLTRRPRRCVRSRPSNSRGCSISKLSAILNISKRPLISRRPASSENGTWTNSVRSWKPARRGVQARASRGRPARSDREFRRLAESKAEGPPPAVIAARERYKELTQEYAELRVRQCTNHPPPTRGGGSGSIIRVDDQNLGNRRRNGTKEEEGFAQQLDKVRVEGFSVNNDSAFDATYLNRQIATLMSWEDQVRKNLEQLRFEANQDRYRVVLVDPASELKVAVPRPAAQCDGGRADTCFLDDSRLVHGMGAQAGEIVLGWLSLIVSAPFFIFSRISRLVRSACF